jgi:RNA polymerase sigma factor (sigma-70 family)
METHTLNPVIDQLRKCVLLPDGAGLTDGQLLEFFVSRNDESAFEVLVRRHGPMVLGVCRRVLGNYHDAEDAFQAAFLVLARKAGSVVPRDMVANWLYGVAYRTALKARTVAARRRARERQVTEMPEPVAAAPDESWRELQPLLDRELNRLPDRYRVPIVLCDLEGQSGRDAARQLGCAEGTVASRLSRGRGLLAQRLTRHGLALSGVSLAMLSASNLPASLVASTVKAASSLAAGQALTAGLVSAEVVALTEGVLQAMFLSKLRIGVLLFVALGLAATGWGTYQAWAVEQPAAPEGPQQVIQQGNTKAAEKPAPNQAKEIMELIRQGRQAYEDAKGKKPAEQELAKFLLDMMEKSYRPQDGKQPTPAEKELLKQSKDAFLLAFQLAAEIARAQGKGQAKVAPEEGALPANVSAFVQAYERARALKKALQEQKSSDAQAVMQALDAFLKAGAPSDLALKRQAKTQAVEQAVKEIENAINRVERTVHDRRTVLEALTEIERAVRAMKQNVQEKKDRE